MPTYPHIDSYYEQLRELIEFGGATNEENIRPAFLNCLSEYCKEHSERFVLVPELRSDRSNKPDGTIRDSLRMTRGLWEAKDTHDDLDREIRNKLGQGYSGDNILFENSRTAVLVQGDQEVLRTDMANAAALDELIRRFLDYELPEIQEFRDARQQFKDDLPSRAGEPSRNHRRGRGQQCRVPEGAAQIFLELCHQSISPKVTNDNVREMLIQHILTKDIFLRVFGEDQFHRENNVARQLDALEGTFFTGNVRRQAVDRLRAYYGAIGRAADDIAEYSEKQQFLKGIYEDFYQAYNPGAADRLGVVYTPNEVVDFIIRGTDWLLQKHFGKTLGDKNVNILDPATGTGTFITNLMNHLPADRLEYKYLREIHANEVEILPYYIANLNIEYTFKELTGRYLEFPNLCFVDTLDNMNWKGASGATVQRQTMMNLGGFSEENWIRVQEQNEKPISVIIGNPPYNANQQNENDNNKNREYPQIDRRISETYIRHSTAQKTKQYDMYKRFIRWASDRLEDDGIVGFVSNSAFLNARQDDGFRKVLAEEFNELWAVDLKGNARTSGERRRQEGGNVFSDKIRVGVAIYFLVRRKGLDGFRVFYNVVDDYAKAFDKIAYVNGKVIDDLKFVEITPDAKSNWLDQSDSNFEQLLPLANRETKLAKSVANEQAVFGLYSQGIVTARDEWVYDFDREVLGGKVRAFINEYEESRAKFGGNEFADSELGTSIKWTRALKRQLRLDVPNTFDRDRWPVHHLPSVRGQVALLQPKFERNAVPTAQHISSRGNQRKQGNRAFSGVASSKPFQVLSFDVVANFHSTLLRRASVYRSTATRQMGIG